MTILGIKTGCPAGSKAACFHAEGSNFYRNCGADNWFDARSRCRNQGMHLAVSVINHQSEPVLQGWLQGRGPCVRLWLGYSRESWYKDMLRGGK